MESWFLVPRFEKVLIRKDTTKIYTQKRISCGRTRPIVCTLARDGAMSRKIPVKRVRAKSVVLAEPLRKGDVVMIAYERWAYGRVEERSGNVSVFIESDYKSREYFGGDIMAKVKPLKVKTHSYTKKYLKPLKSPEYSIRYEIEDIAKSFGLFLLQEGAFSINVADKEIKLEVRCVD